MEEQYAYETYLRTCIRWSRRECCTGSGARSKAARGLAPCLTETAAGRPSGLKNTRSSAAVAAVKKPGCDAADEQYSMAENVANGAEPNPVADGAGDAAA